MIGEFFMKKKSLLLRISVPVLTLASLAGCTGLQNSNTIVVWVGSESVAYYRELAKKFESEHADFGYKISIIGADTGGAAGQMVADNGACGDIVTIAHDNIGKLSQASYIAPIVDDGTGKELVDQINADNPEGFKTVIKNILGEDTKYTYTFGVPYISQALFLYYDTRFVKEEEAESFEGLLQAAKRYDSEHSVKNTKSYAVTGNDGYNFSFSVLARNLDKGNVSSLRLYENGDGRTSKEVRYDSYMQANEQVAILKYMQRNVADPNGGLLKSDSGWATNIEQHKALSLIGGAWHYNSFKAAVTDKDTGEVHMGCKIIPTFTLTAADVQGIEATKYSNDEYLPAELRGKDDPAPVAGTKFRGGSFVDCKCFVINMAKMTGAEKYYKMCTLLKYFSSKQAQNESFLKALNVPAYAGAEQYIEEVKSQIDKTAYLMASSQTGMSVYGIPQPFTSGTLNTFYYSKSAPDYYFNAIMDEKKEYTTVESIRKLLYRMEYIWKHGASPSNIPTTLPNETSNTH